MIEAGNNIPLSPDLVDLIRKTADAEGRKPEEIVEDAVNSYIADHRWQQVLAYGKRQAKDMGFTEDDVERLVHESRAVQDPVP
jgi:predicted transcriptional regulator